MNARVQQLSTKVSELRSGLKAVWFVGFHLIVVAFVCMICTSCTDRSVETNTGLWPGFNGLGAECKPEFDFQTVAIIDRYASGQVVSSNLKLNIQAEIRNNNTYPFNRVDDCRRISSYAVLAFCSSTESSSCQNQYIVLVADEYALELICYYDVTGRTIPPSRDRGVSGEGFE